MSPGGPFVVSVDGLDEHVVCASLEQALEMAELLSQQHQRRVIVIEQGEAAPLSVVESQKR